MRENFTNRRVQNEAGERRYNWKNGLKGSNRTKGIDKFRRFVVPRNLKLSVDSLPMAAPTSIFQKGMVPAFRICINSKSVFFYVVSIFLNKLHFLAFAKRLINSMKMRFMDPCAGLRFEQAITLNAHIFMYLSMLLYSMLQCNPICNPSIGVMW